MVEGVGDSLGEGRYAKEDQDDLAGLPEDLDLHTVPESFGIPLRNLLRPSPVKRHISDTLLKTFQELDCDTQEPGLVPDHRQR